MLALGADAPVEQYATLPTWHVPRRGKKVWATAWAPDGNDTVE